MRMFKNMDADIRRMSKAGAYYKDIAKVLGMGASGLFVYMDAKGIDMHLKRKRCEPRHE